MQNRSTARTCFIAPRTIFNICNNYNRKESEKECDYIYIFLTQSVCCTLSHNIIHQKYVSLKKQQEKNAYPPWWQKQDLNISPGVISKMANSSPEVLQTVFHDRGSSSTCPESSTFPEFAAERRVLSLLSCPVLPVSHEPLAREKWRLATPPTSSRDPIKHKLPSIHNAAPERRNGSIFLSWGPEAGGFVLKFRPIRHLFSRGFTLRGAPGTHSRCLNCRSSGEGKHLLKVYRSKKQREEF